MKGLVQTEMLLLFLIINVLWFQLMIYVLGKTMLGNLTVLT